MVIIDVRMRSIFHEWASDFCCFRVSRNNFVAFRLERLFAKTPAGIPLHEITASLDNSWDHQFTPTPKRSHTRQVIKSTNRIAEPKLLHDSTTTALQRIAKFDRPIASVAVTYDDMFLLWIFSILRGPVSPNRFRDVTFVGIPWEQPNADIGTIASCQSSSMLDTHHS